MESANAVVEKARNELLAEGMEISVLLRERDTRGNSSEIRISFGCSQIWCWVYQEVANGPEYPRLSIEIDERRFAQEMFSAYLNCIMERKQLIDPSPLSGQLCELTPTMRLVVEELWNAFTVKVDPWN